MVTMHHCPEVWMCGHAGETQDHSESLPCEIWGLQPTNSKTVDGVRTPECRQ